MKKISGKTLLPLVLFALVLILLSIPVYFYIVNQIWLEEIDEHHAITKNKIEQELNLLGDHDEKISETIGLWNTLQHGVNISPVPTTGTDLFYTSFHYDVYHGEEEQFRGYVSYFIIHHQPYKIVIETNMEEMDETIFSIALVAIVFFMVLLAGFIILNRIISGKVWRPFYHTLEKVKSFDLEGNEPIQLERSTTKEFEELNQAIRKLVEKNISVYRQQKEFTENASHELQTPLSILKSKLDLLVQDPALTEHQADMINAMHIPLSRASRINKNLLLLAKIENRQFSNTEPVDLSIQLAEDLDLLSEHIRHKSLLIQTEIEKDIIVQANTTLVEILSTNLLVNAIRHSPENGTIRIRLTPASLVISNTGTESLNKEALFKRFISSSSATPSSGLGLAIIRQVTNVYGWQAGYHFENGMHIFSIRF